MNETQEQRHIVDPEIFAEWQDSAGNYENLFRGGQAWIKTDTVVEIER